MLKGPPLLITFLLFSGLAYASNEHWVCSFPHKLEPTRTVFMEYEVRGDKLLLTQYGVEYQIIRNDDRVLVAVHAPDLPIPDQVVQAVGIDKRTGRFKYISAYFGEGDIVSMGDCQRRTDAPQ